MCSLFYNEHFKKLENLEKTVIFFSVLKFSLRAT